MASAVASQALHRSEFYAARSKQNYLLPQKNINRNKAA